MIVRLEVCASEKVAARSQYEPNNYSVLVSVDQLTVERPEELVGQAGQLFSRAKEAIRQAMRSDGLDRPASGIESSSSGLDHDAARHQNGRHNGGAPQASDKQLRLIQQLARQRRMERDDLEALCHEAVGHPSHQLSKFDASRVITALKGGDR